MSSKYYLAIDIGASSGRHIVGWMENGEWKTDEVYRFPNGVTELDGHLTIYQLYTDKLAGRLEGVTDFLMIPEYLLYKLCGVKSHEYTNATTGGLVNAKTGEFDQAIIEALDLPKDLFGELMKPGAVIGEYKGIKCVLCATHDTASAVEGIPMDTDQPYISSGTWSLLGVKSPEAITNTGMQALAKGAKVLAGKRFSSGTSAKELSGWASAWL